MRKTPNKGLIGLFTLVGLFMFISTIGFFLKDKIAPNDDELMVMYFDESIKGLKIGSPIVFRGVEIGKVVKIDMVVNIEKVDFDIPVFMRLNNNQNFIMENNRIYKNKKKFINELIERGLKARLKTQSLLTGQLMVELEILPNVTNKYKYNYNEQKILEIPTAISALGELSKGLEDLSIKETIDRLNMLLKSLDDGIPKVLKNANDLIASFNRIANGEKANITFTLDNMNKMINSVNDAARTFKNLADYLERHPEALIKGKGGY